MRSAWLISVTLGAAQVMFAAPNQAMALPDNVQLPASALAWWRLNPSRFRAVREQGAQRFAVLATLRALVASGVVSDEQGKRVLEGVLAAAEVGSAPHTLVLTDFAAKRPPGGSGMDLQRLRMALSVGAGANHRSMLRTIRAILISDGGASKALAPAGKPSARGEQRALDLPGDRHGVAYAQPDWPEWREVSWSSTPGAFVVGLGPGALEEWFTAQDGPGRADAAKPVAEKQRPWFAHRALVDDVRKPGDVFFEAYVNIDALRTRFPGAFVTGRTTRTLRALGLANAHDLMVHGRWIDPALAETDAHPPLIALDVTWSTPALVRFGAIAPRDVHVKREIHRLALTEDIWPAQELHLPPPNGSFALVMRIDWPALTTLSLDLVQATRRDTRLGAFVAFRGRWEAFTDGAREGLFKALGPIVVISDDPPPLLPAPGAATYFLELNPGTDADRALAQVQQLLAPLRHRVTHTDAGVWSIRLDDAGFVRAPVWGVAGPKESQAIIVGWGATIIDHIRKRRAPPSSVIPH